MKRLLTLFLLMYMSLSAMASETSVKNADGVDIWYKFNSSTKTASVTYRGTDFTHYSGEYSGEVVIPSTVTYEGVEYSVTSIGAEAFYSCDALTSVTIPEGVTSIGDYAFYYCDALTSITLPEGLTEIGDYAFRSCSALTSITLPEGVTSIGNYAFTDCSALTSITIPKGLTSIGKSAFRSCSALTSITLPEGVTSIGDYVFAYCYSLTSITLPEGVTSIGNDAFYECDALTSITLPEGVTSIGYYAFSGCNSLISITLPESLTSIGYEAFYNCYKLYEVYNKSNLTITAGNSDNGSVAYYAKNVYTDSEGESKLKTVGDYIFYVDGEDIELIAYTGSETSITLPSDYEGKNYNIGDYAFYECYALTSITLPKGVTSIGEAAFRSCDALTSITLPEGLTSIGGAAFEYCSSLTSITLPESVTSIGYYAFNYCYRLYEVYNKSDLTITAGDSDNGYVAYYAKNVYSEGESKLKTVGDYIFYVDGEDIELIAYTGSETSITLPSDYEGKNYNIGDYAFYECDALTSITLPEGLTSIGKSAFRSCYALTSITLPESLTSIGGWTFAYCYALTSITLPEGLTSIGDYAFSSCDVLTSITLPKGLTSIGKSVFRSCYSLTSITLPESLTSIGDYAFYECDALTSITLPEGLTSIGEDAFAYCDALTSITLPESLTSIGDDAFFSCDALTSITSKNTTPPTIGDSYTFYDVDKSIPVYVPKSSVDAYKSAEYWKDFTNFIGGAYFVDVTAENGTVKGAGAYEENAEVTLKATPAEGYKFVKWSDGVTDNPRTVVVTSDMTFTADIQKCWTVNVTAENGDILGDGVYLEGDEATLTATPNEGYKFVKWSDGVTDNPRTVVVVSDTTFTAVFELKEYTLTIDAENGTVEGAGTYKYGDEVTLTATPIVGYIFTKWSDGVTDNPRTVVVVSDTTFTAVFEIDNTPISDIQTSDVKVRLIGNRVVVEGADDYTVYSISGQNLGKVERVERGIYIVVVNGKSYKVIAK